MVAFACSYMSRKSKKVTAPVMVCLVEFGWGSRGGEDLAWKSREIEMLFMKVEKVKRMLYLSGL